MLHTFLGFNVLYSLGFYSAIYKNNLKIIFKSWPTKIGKIEEEKRCSVEHA